MNQLVCRETIETSSPTALPATSTIDTTVTAVETVPASVPASVQSIAREQLVTVAPTNQDSSTSADDHLGLDEAEVYTFLRDHNGARVSEIEAALSMNRFQAVNALRSLAQKGILAQRNNRLYVTA
jgi:hypothetical protein